MRKAPILATCSALLTWVLLPVGAEGQTQTITNTPYPAVVRVAIRGFNNPVAPIQYVQTVGFQEYCKDVLPNEWMADWNVESLRAGAIAVKMFAWYHTLHPTKAEGFTFDVDNTTNFQQFKYLSGQYITDKAVNDTWNMVYVPPDGSVSELEYRSGFPNSENRAFIGSGVMAQWGSEYWGRVAKLSFSAILNLYYPADTLRFI